MAGFKKNIQYYKFCSYGFLKNLRFFDAFFILYLVDKGLPYTQIGVLYAIREVVINVVEVPSGFIADTYGRKSALLGSFAAYMISFAVFYFSSGFGLFTIAFVLYGVGDAFRSGTHKAMIMEYLKIKQWEGQKVNYYGHTRSWSQLGSALSSLVAGAIVFMNGKYQNVFLYSIVPYILNFVLILSYPKTLNHSAGADKSVESYNVLATLKSFFVVIRHKSVLRIINTSAVHSAYLKAVKDYIQILMVGVVVLIPLFVGYEDKQRNGIVIGIIYFIIYLLTSRASAISGRFDSKGKSNIAFITLIIGFGFGALSGILYLAEISVFALVAFVGIYIVENLRKPILTGYIADRVPNKILASVLSAQSLLKTIMTAVLAVVLGFLSDKFGIGIAFMAVSLLLIIITVLFSIFFKNEVDEVSVA